MAKRFIDISVPLQAGVKSDPPPLLPKIEYIDHQQGALEVLQGFPGMTIDQLPGREGFAAEKLTITAHNGTHLDAPWHYGSTTNGGEPSPTIDQIPLDWCFRPGVKLDFRDKPDGYVCTALDVKNELKRIGYQLQPLDIVLVNTAAGAAYGQDDYIERGCGMGREATLYLTERGVRVTGTDSWGWDAPMSFVMRRIKETGNFDLWWEGHRAGRERAYCHIEKLHNLEVLPAFGFTVSCFPVKLERGSAGWTRAVAIIDG